MKKIFAIIAVAFAMSACATSPAPATAVAENATCRWVPSYVRAVRDESMCGLHEGKDITGKDWVDTRPAVSTVAKRAGTFQK